MTETLAPQPGRPPGISVVIPTRNRPASLDHLLCALDRQERPPEEVLVIDAGDAPLDDLALLAAHPRLPITVLRAAPGVCAQRNAGIRRADRSHVLLCDDDIEPPPDYIRRILAFAGSDPEAGAVTGVLSEPDAAGRYGTGFEVPSLRHLLYAFLFQLTVWGDVEATTAGRLTAPLLGPLRRWYRRRGNTWSLAGWPLVTHVRGPVVRTATYGLGAALVRRDWLLASPFDERLGPHGIGDNYGVALGFPADRAIAVLTDLPVLHHRAAENRLDAAESYFRRVLALDCFTRTSARFGPRTTAWLAWSLVGNAIRFALRGRGALLGRTLRALAIVATGRNPLLRAGRGS